MATTPQRTFFLFRQTVHKLTLKYVPNCQKNSQKQPVFSGLIKNSRMVMKFDPYSSLMIKSGNIILIVFHLCCCSKHKFSITLIANVANFARLVMQTCWFQTFSLHFIYDLITIMEYSCKHEFSTINMLYCLTKLSFYTPTSPWWPFLHNSQFLLSTRWPLWRGSTELLLSFIYQGLLRHLELLSC